MELQTFSLKTQNPDTLMLHNDMQTCCKQMKLWHFQGHSHFIAMLCLLLNNKEFSNLWGRIYSRIIVAKSNHWRKLWLCHVSQCEGITASPLGLVSEMVPNLEPSCAFTHKNPGLKQEDQWCQWAQLPKLPSHRLQLRHQPQWKIASLDGTVQERWTGWLSGASSVERE